MRLQQDSREITVNKQDLMNKIKANKEKHIKEYEEAKTAYFEKAKELISAQNKKLKAGKMNLGFTLTSPVDKRDEYDKILQMFEWEVKDEVVLSTGEFNEYVLDELPFSIQARLSNLAYSKGI